MKPVVTVSKKELKQFCIHNGIRRLAFFGSVLRDDFGPDSDVDVLVEFDPEAVVGFFKLYDIEKELSGMLGGRKIDVHTPKGLSRYIRDNILAEAVDQYVEA